MAADHHAVIRAIQDHFDGRPRDIDPQTPAVQNTHASQNGSASSTR